MASGSTKGNGAGPRRDAAPPIDKRLSKSLENGLRNGAPPVPRSHGEDYHSHPLLSNHEARRVAVAALCDPRTLYKYLHGAPQNALVKERIEKGLRETGHENLIGHATRQAATRAENARRNPSGH